MGKPSSGLIVRICLLGLPIGLLVLGAGSIFITTILPGNQRGPDGIRPPGPRTGQVPGGIATERLREHVDILVNRIGERNAGNYANLEAAKFYLQSTLGPSNLGYIVRERNYEVDGVLFTNVEAEMPGTSRGSEILVVGAHYDTAPGTAGADDNASGVAALLTLAEAFEGRSQARTLRFVAFVNEEPPWFQTENMGSLRYARDMKDGGADIVAMLSLESLGYYDDAPGSQRYPPQIADEYPDRGNFLAVVGNPASRNLTERVYETFAKTGVLPVERGVFPEIVPGVGWSDHWAFWQIGVPAVMLTDTAPFRNPHYHQITDRPGTLDFERFTLAVLGIRAVIEDLANPPVAR